MLLCSGIYACYGKSIDVDAFVFYSNNEQVEFSIKIGYKERSTINTNTQKMKKNK